MMDFAENLIAGEYRVIVCGGRMYGLKELPNRMIVVDQAKVDFAYAKLDLLRAAALELGLQLVIIQGGAKGADAIAKAWATARNVQQREFKADWSKGKAAGFIRNKQMLDEGRPHLVIGFPGGKGTAMMLEIAAKAGVPTRSYA